MKIVSVLEYILWEMKQAYQAHKMQKFARFLQFRNLELKNLSISELQKELVTYEGLNNAQDQFFVSGLKLSIVSGDY